MSRSSPKGVSSGFGDARSPVAHRMGECAVETEQYLPDYASAVRDVIARLTDARTGVLADLSDLHAVGFKTVHLRGKAGTHLLTRRFCSAWRITIPSRRRTTALYPSHSHFSPNAIPTCLSLAFLNPRFTIPSPTTPIFTACPTNGTKNTGFANTGFTARPIAMLPNVRRNCSTERICASCLAISEEVPPCARFATGNLLTRLWASRRNTALSTARALELLTHLFFLILWSAKICHPRNGAHPI